MPEQPPRTRIDGVDWHAVFPFLLIFRSFRMAVSPTKLILGLLLAILLYLGGWGLDYIWGPSVFPSELQDYQARGVDDFRDFISEKRKLAEQAQYAGATIERAPIFQTLLGEELEAFQSLMESAISLKFGFYDILVGGAEQRSGALGSLAVMLVDIPGWLFTAHRGFLIVFMAYGFLLTALLGGAIARIAAAEACRRESLTVFAGLRYAMMRFGSFVAAPLLPLVMVLVVGILLAVGGAAAFNWWITDLIGGALFLAFLLGGFVIALLLIGYAGAGNLLFSAVAVDGADPLDAFTRTYNYVFGRPWRYIFYSALSLVYGAITYIFITFLIYLTLRATRSFTGMWTVAEVADGVGRFDAIFPEMPRGRLIPPVQWDQLDVSGRFAAVFVLAWTKLLVLLLPALAVSYYQCAQTWVYLLLRRDVDGTEIDELFTEPHAVLAPDVPDKIEPPADADTDEPDEPER